MQAETCREGKLGNSPPRPQRSGTSLTDQIEKAYRRPTRLAVFLYGRLHTRELGVRVAATCEAALLMQIAGTLGEVIYAQSRDGYVRPSYGEDRRSSRSAVSLAGPHKTGDHHA